MGKTAFAFLIHEIIGINLLHLVLRIFVFNEFMRMLYGKVYVSICISKLMFLAFVFLIFVYNEFMGMLYGKVYVSICILKLIFLVFVFLNICL